MNYKIILKTSSRHKERISNCLNTWLKELDYILLTDIPLGGIGEEFSGSNRTDYSSNEEKTVNFLNYCKQNNTYSNYDWFIFIDDDAIINRRYIEYILPHFDKNYVYGLRMTGAWPKDTSLDFPSGGSGYFISRELIQSMTPMSIQGHGQEDVSMGEWLRENNKSIESYYTINNKKYHLKLNGWYPFHDIPDKTCNLINYIDKNKEILIKKHLTHHYIREKCIMEYIYKLFNEWSPEEIND
jgi:hypothetical protein